MAASFLISTNGCLWGWGYNRDEESGEVRIPDEFKKVSIDGRFTMVSRGDSHVMAIDEYGCLWTYGTNYYYQLGLGDNKKRSKFRKVKSNKRFVMVSCGYSHTMALDEDGYLWACGSNANGRLGFGDRVSSFVTRFEKIPSDKRFKMVCCGAIHTMAIDVDGYLWICGFTHKEGYMINKFEQIPSDKRFVMVSCKDFHTMAVDEDGFLWGLGYNHVGQLGLGDFEDRTGPDLSLVTSDKRFTMVSCGHTYTIAIDEDGHLWGCGCNSEGQLGLGDEINRNKFERLLSDESFTMVSCENYHTLAIDGNGCLWFCGVNRYDWLLPSRNKLEKVKNINNVGNLMNNTLMKKRGSNIKGAHNHPSPHPQ